MTIDELNLHLLAQLQEDLPDIVASLGAALHIIDSVVLGQSRGLLKGDLPLALEILFVADEKDTCLVARGLREVFHPVF